MRSTLRRSGFSLALGAAALIGFSAALGDARPVPAQQAVTPGFIVVQGQIKYIDQQSNRNHPAAGLKVEIMDIDQGPPGVSQVLGTTVTDANGFFKSTEITNKDTDGPTGRPAAGQDVFLRLKSNNGTIRLYKLGTKQDYAWQSYEIDEQNGISRDVLDGVVATPPLIIMENTKDVEALWTFVSLADAWYYMKAQSGRDPGELTAYWSPTSQDGPRYDGGTRELFFRNDNAGYSDVVVQQAAYALLHNLLGSLPAEWATCLAGPGEEMKRSGTAACALVQGFASFLPAAVYQEPLFESPATSGLDLDLARAGSLGWQDGDMVSGRVAGAFWDLIEVDPTQDGSDQFNATFKDIWQVIDEKRPTTMAAWWAGWKASGKDACSAIGSLAQNTINYNTDPMVVPGNLRVELDEDTTRSVDLRTVVTDADCPGDRMVFRLMDSGDRNAGVRFVPTSTISITPTANWFGTTQVQLEADDGVKSIPFTMTVVVKPINDCPKIQPAISDPPAVRWKEPVILNLFANGKDVENQPQELTWTVEVQAQNQGEITCVMAGPVLTCNLIKDTTEAYRALLTVTVADMEGCKTSQFVRLIWDSRPNQAPFIRYDKLRREYMARQGETVTVDLVGIGDDDEDGEEPLEWFIDNPPLLHAISDRDLVTKKKFTFIPQPIDYIGSQLVELSVVDTGGLRARTSITVTWLDAADIDNLPPRILRAKVDGKSVGLNTEACYALHDKAEDPDDPVSSLRWYFGVDDKGRSLVDPKDFTITREGGVDKTICFKPNPITHRNWEGCTPTPIMVLDPHPINNRDDYVVQSCWRKIEVFFPYMPQNHLLRR
ncbi:MAG: hypothetical protein IPJ58_01020 [Ardenticatenia bacterium]|nr:hypothetical protein [Ardenticatenia bacterium]